MTISNEDIVYMGDLGGELISYDLNTQVVRFHGNMGYDCAGDLTFYKGELYMAARDNKIIKVNIEQPELSELVLTYASSSEILGIVSDYRGCDDTRVYGLTGDSTEVLLIDFENLTGEFVCQLSLNVNGGASTSEFLASIPVTLGTPVILQPDCKSLTGSVSFPDASAMGEVSFRLGENEWQSEPFFGDLVAGVYSFQLQDEEGCMDSIEIELKPYPLLVLEELLVTNASCNLPDGELMVKANGGTGVLTYSLSGILFQLTPYFTGLTAGTYTIYVRDNSGCIVQQTVGIGNNGLSDFQNYDVLNTTCRMDNGAIFLYPDEMESSKYMFSLNGGPFQAESVFENLSTGLYAIVVKHQDGCMDTLGIMVGSLESPQVRVVAVAPEACNARNGEIRAEVISGIPPFRFNLNNTHWETSSNFTHLQSGDYIVYVQDGNGCVDSLDVFIDLVEGPRILVISTQPTACFTSDGSLQVDWESHDDASTMSVWDEQAEQVYDLDHLAPGDYRIFISDSYGCTLDTTVTVHASGCELAIPNIFSPNGDGVNDVFKVGLLPGDTKWITTMMIYDRWGNQLYVSPLAHDNHTEVFWDGLSQGVPCSPGVYTYRLTLMDIDQSRQNVFGDITLIR